MFMSKNLLKKISVVVASLALIIPLASVSNISVSASRVHKHVRVVRVIKHYNKRARRHIVKHMRIGSLNYYNSKINNSLNKDLRSKAYNYGFNDALSARVNHKLIHNDNYKKGYLQIIALDDYTDPSDNKRIPNRLSKNALNDAKVYYNYCILK